MGQIRGLPLGQSRASRPNQVTSSPAEQDLSEAPKAGHIATVQVQGALGVQLGTANRTGLQADG